MTVINLAVGSQNPVKIAAAEQGFSATFPEWQVTVEGHEVPSGVSDQPMSDAETLLGATQRARQVIKVAAPCDYAIGIEGGIETIDSTLFAYAWIVIIDRAGRVGRGRSGSFALPPKVKELVDCGLELGHANDQVFRKVNSKHAGGAVGSLTGGVISRQSLYEHAMVLSLAAFRHNDLYFGQS